MKKILLISLLLSSTALTKSIHEYHAYYPNSFTPEGCMAWHEDGSSNRRNCSINIVCYGVQQGEYMQYSTRADACKDLKSPFSIKYRKSEKDDVFYLDINEILKK